VERFAPLIRDPLRLDGAALPARALRRLENAAARTGPLRGGGNGLAALTRVRLDALTRASTGDEALAAALARAASAPAGAAAEPRAADPGLRRIGADPLPRRIGAVAPELLRPARQASRRHERVTPSREPSGSALAALMRNAEAPVPDVVQPRTVTRSMARSAPSRPAGDHPSASPQALKNVSDARGLEWLADRVAGGREASETPVIDGFPDVKPASPALVSRTRTPAPADPEPRRQAATGAAVAHDAPVTRPVARPRGALGPRGGGAGGLEALVQAWRGSEESSVQTAGLAVPPGIGSPLATAKGGFSAAEPVPAARPAGRGRLEDLHARDQDVTVIADSLGRLLVDELRRYGIEVDEG
jgi:hypothetical protein